MPGPGVPVSTGIREDGGVRWTPMAVVGAAVLAALMIACTTGSARPAASARLTSPVRPAGAARHAGAVRLAVAVRIASAAGPASSAPPASTASCYDFAVSAIRSHVVVRRRPAVCAGLSQAEINQVVARAIRTAVGPHPKAIERRLAEADSRYLGSLVKPVQPPPAAGVAVTTTTTSGDLALRFSALAAWLAAAIAGGYLLAPWLIRVGRRRMIRMPGLPTVVPLAHAGLAITGLCVWIAFTASGIAALAWADVGLTWLIAGLGMATLLAANPEQAAQMSTQATAPGEPAATEAAPFPGRAPVVIIALHGALATLAILLVLLAAVGIG